jgi:amino acid transporter
VTRDIIIIIIILIIIISSSSSSSSSSSISRTIYGHRFYPQRCLQSHVDQNVY